MADNTNYAPMVRFDNAWVMEHAANGSRVAQLLGYDQEGDAMSFSLVHDAGGRFALHDGYLVVADGERIDYETAESYSIMVRATDEHGAYRDSVHIFYTKNYDGPDDTPPPPLPNNEAPIILKLSANRVPEHANPNITVGWVKAIDPDGDVLSYELADNASGRFALDGNRLVVAAPGVLDYETHPTHDVTIRVKDARGLSTEQVFTIQVLDSDYDNGPVPPPENHAPVALMLSNDWLWEDTPNDSAIGYFSATDPDGDWLTYELIDNADGAFRLHGEMLVVADASKLDFETRPEIQVRLRVKDSRGETTEKAFVIHVRDVAEPPPENRAPVDLALSNHWVFKNSDSGTVIGHFSAMDPDGDQMVYELVGNADGIFRLENNLLVVADGSRLDFETNRHLDVTLRVTDSRGDSSERSFLIEVADVPEGPPPRDLPPIEVRLWGGFVPENAASGVGVGNLTALDPEGGAVRFELVDNAGGRFAIHGDIIVVADGSRLDYEADPTHSVRVRAIDLQGGSTEASFTITVQDVDENEGPPGNAPPAMIMLDGVQVFENAASGTHIGELRAFDPNGDALTFALLDNADGRFAIQDGRVVVADGTKLDFETSSAHRIEVRVSDVHGAHLDALFTIHVRDVPEQGPPPPNRPPIDIWMDGGVVLENAPDGIVFAQLGAFDPDGDPLQFELIDSADGLFALQSNGLHAALRVRDGSRLDYESAATHAIKVRVSDIHGGSFEKVFTVHVIDVAEDPDSLDIEMHQGSVLENASGGTNVAHFSVTQPHPDPVTYELVDDAGGLFRLQGQALVVADGADIDYEANATHTIKVRATDVRGATTIETFTVKVLDVADEDETPPSDNEAPTGLQLSDNTVAENTENGTTVGILVGEDEDTDETFTYTLLDNAGGRFALDGDQLVVADGARLDHEASPSHQVTVRVTDSEGASFTETFTLFVEDEVEETVQGTPGNDTIFGGAGSDALSGGLGNDVVTGGAGNDALSGDAGADRLFGGQGRDRISGGLGKDILTGGAGKDFFVFDKWPGPENIDRITDFSVRDDTIELDASTFKGIGKRGVLAKDKFWIGAGAHDSGDRVVYNSDNGKLYFDADGSGHKQAVLIAILKNNLMLSHKDFIIG